MPQLSRIVSLKIIFLLGIVPLSFIRADSETRNLNTTFVATEGRGPSALRRNGCNNPGNPALRRSLCHHVAFLAHMIGNDAVEPIIEEQKDKGYDETPGTALQNQGHDDHPDEQRPH